MEYQGQEVEVIDHNGRVYRGIIEGIGNNPHRGIFFMMALGEALFRSS